MSVNLSQSDLDYIAIAVAHKLADLMRHPDEDWLSQNKAWKRYGGRAFVERLRNARKVRTRKNGNRIEYYVKDLKEHSFPKVLKGS